MTKEFQLGHGSFTPAPTGVAAQIIENQLATIAKLEAELAMLRAENASFKAQLEELATLWKEATDAFAAWRAAQGPQP